MSRIHRIARYMVGVSSQNQREQLLSDYIKMISFDGKREIAPTYIEHLRKQFNEMPLSGLLQRIEEDKLRVETERGMWDLNQLIQRDKENKKRLDLVTKAGEYERTNSTFERAVCSDENPLFEQKGMPAFGDEVSSHDPELKGYYGVHVGGGWLPIMIRDQYCEHDNAYLYEIDTAPVYRSKKPFYIMEDFHVMDRTNVPHSEVLFSKNLVIPASLIKLKKMVPVSKIKPAPDLY